MSGFRHVREAVQAGDTEVMTANMASWASQGIIKNTHSKEALLANISPAIREVLFHQGLQDPAIMNELGEAIHLIGS